MKIVAIANVELPIKVKIPWRVTKPYKDSRLSNMCQDIAHMALIKLGIIAMLNQKNVLYFSKLLIFLIINIA